MSEINLSSWIPQKYKESNIPLQKLFNGVSLLLTGQALENQKDEFNWNMDELCRFVVDLFSTVILLREQVGLPVLVNGEEAHDIVQKVFGPIVPETTTKSDLTPN